MKTFAYCSASFIKSVRTASGVEPLVCPPMIAEDFDPLWLTGYQFLYFNLHGLPNQPYWYGDSWITALSAKQIESINLNGAVVFVANCYLVGKKGQSPMLDALLKAGAQAVVGGPGPNWGRPQTLDGADLLGKAFRVALSVNFPPAIAFKIARFRLQGTFRKDKAVQDALDFRLFERQPYLDSQEESP